MVEDRKCRDVLFLLAFAAYWAGMFVVAGIAFKEGDPRRLVYALDSRGLLCGTNNTYRGAAVDLTDKPNLYYLNALDLLDPATIPYAKSVCVAECPGEMQRCSLAAAPCTRDTTYRCPYYRFAEEGLYGQLAGVADTDTAYWGALSGAAAAACNATFLALAGDKLPGLSALADPSVCASAGGGGAYLQATSHFPGKGPCYPVWAATAPYFNRCFPKFPPEIMGAAVSALDAGAGVAASAAGALADDYAGAGAQLAVYIADISKGMLIVAGAGLGAGIVLSLVWMLVLRFFAGIMAWATIAVVNAALAGCALYAWYLSGKLSASGEWGATVASQFAGFAGQDPSLVSRENWAYIAYAATAIAGVVLLFTLVMLRRVAVAVACIKVASQAVAKMPSIMLFPLLPFVLEVGLVIYWVAVAATLYSAGAPTPHWRGADQFKPVSLSSLVLDNDTAPAMEAAPAGFADLTGDDLLDACASSLDCYVSYDWNDRLMYAFIFHLFGLLWANQFIVGFSSVVVAGAVGSYYWSRGDARKMPAFPVVRAMRRTVIYNLGSIALGSFVIAIIQFVRLVLSYLDKKTRKIQQESKAAAWLMCIVKFLVWLLEKIVAFINRNAYIVVAVKGSNYCTSAARGVQLVVANALRLATVNVVGDALLFLGKLAVAACCGLAAFGLANLRYYNDPEAYPSTHLSSAIFPIAVAVLTGFVVAQIFFSVYELAIDATLLSFCEDAEANGGHPRYAPPLLMEAIGEPYAADDRDARDAGGMKRRPR
ncbi:MAG: plasma-membrane choline transporter-domain-containing protein [Monoraphidium minutum]|nr:MAG: plasma-membrane choline transporter-domain-containing protein [Monoraphidium minutum]